MHKKAIAFAVKLFVTVGLFTLLFRPETFGLAPDFWGEDISLRSLIDEIRSVETHHILVWVLFAVAVKLAGMLFGVLRWRLLLQGQGLRMPFWYMVQSWFVGRFIGIFLPGTIGLDGYRLYDSSLYTGEVIKSFTVIAVEKLIGFVALTLLVFVTFPMGLRLLPFKIPVLLVCMTIFGGFVVVSLLTLLNPRVIQVLVAVIPTPKAVRSKFDKLGAAAAAYGGSRGLLLLAVLCGVLVHVGTCFMYFGTMSAIRAENTTIFDIFFTSPLMIWGTVLGPSVGGEGIREIVFTTVLGATSGTTKAFLIAHLGWWVGELVPFLIGLPIFVFRSRPNKEEMEAKVAEARAKAAAVDADVSLHLTPEQVHDYRDRIINALLAGLGGGVLGGALIGLAEAGWVVKMLQGLTEFNIFWWGPAVYAVLFSGVGLGVAGALLFLYLLMNRFLRPQTTLALSLGGAVAAGALIIGRFRFQRDVLMGHGMSLAQNGMVLVGAVGIGLVLAVVLALILTKVRVSRAKGVAGAALAFVVLLVIGATAAKTAPSTAPEGVYRPEKEASGPNIILIVVDALRADYLPLFSADATAKTPHIDAFAEDSVVFQNCFSQASWTKPSFATIFSGLYPGSHTATSKTAALPDDVTTFPEVLLDGGYYTKGFANNGNIAPIFDFNQGFADYTELKKNRCLGASESASNLSLYNALVKAKEVLAKRLFGEKITITDYYQPAEAVTQTALTWMDGAERPKDVPFFLMLHYMETHDPFMDWDSPGVGYARRRMPNPDASEYLEPMRKAYNSEIEHLDKYLGVLFDELKQRGMYDEALIVVTADHGEEFYDHEGWWHGFTLYDEVIHIPLIVKQPKGRQAGVVSADLARHIDLGPTFLQCARLEKPDSMPGESLLNPDGSCANADVGYAYSENDFEGNVLEAVRTKDAKLIRANEDNVSGLEPVEFYDLATDPGEQTNRAGENDAREDALMNLLDGMRAHIKEHAAQPTLLDELPSDLEERLGAIGYLGD